MSEQPLSPPPPPPSASRQELDIESNPESPSVPISGTSKPQATQCEPQSGGELSEQQILEILGTTTEHPPRVPVSGPISRPRPREELVIAEPVPQQPASVQPVIYQPVPVNGSLEQIQWHCNRCGRPTIHTRVVSEVPHVLYLLLSLFLCGLFVPVWIVHAIVHSFAGAGPFLCTQCGQAAGTLTPEQMRAQAERRREAHLKELQTKKKALRECQINDKLESITQQSRRKARAEALVSMGKKIVHDAARLPSQIDRLLRATAGEGNDILYYFLQLVAIVIIAAGAIGLAWLLTSVAWSIVGSRLERGP